VHAGDYALGGSVSLKRSLVLVDCGAQLRHFFQMVLKNTVIVYIYVIKYEVFCLGLYKQIVKRSDDIIYLHKVTTPYIYINSLTVPNRSNVRMNARSKRNLDYNIFTHKR
jgi:hypothetical protein